MSNDCFESDLLVLGGGLAGSLVALKAAEEGHRVLLIEGGESASSWAQGGIVLKSPQDPESLCADILEAGGNRCFEPAVKVLANEGPTLVEQWLVKKIGVKFDRSTTSDDYDYALEAAHSHPRILHVKDGTGAAIMFKVAEKVAHHPRIQRLQGAMIDLLLSNSHDSRRECAYLPTRVWGAYVLLDTGVVVTCVASHTVLATGGFSRLFGHSTGPMNNRGDGIAAAHRAGARTLGMEYIQFHPTALYVPGRPRYLLTEALRGKGALLKNSNGERFVDEMASRDVVARSILEEMLKSGSPHVWLDIGPVKDFENQFPNLVQLLDRERVVLSKSCLPIVPAAHYTIGGVWTDLNGATSLDGLWAAGEVACVGIHGANRLASTSLLECVTFGVRAGNAISAKLKSGETQYSKQLFDPRPWTYENGIVDNALIRQDWETLQQTCWNYLGLIRSHKRLKRAERILLELRAEIESFYKSSKLSRDLLSLRHGALVATLVLYAAIRNKSSVGTHYLKKE
jgi:L-aspartate oxidase